MSVNELVDEVPQEELDEWLALEWMNGEPWEHTAAICAACHNASLLVAATNMDSEQAVKRVMKLSKNPSHFMPPHVKSPPKKRKPVKNETSEQAAEAWMKDMANTGNR